MQREQFHRIKCPRSCKTLTSIACKDEEDFRQITRNQPRRRQCRYSSYHSFKFATFLFLVALQSSCYFVTVVRQVTATTEEDKSVEAEISTDEETQYQQLLSSDLIEDSMFDPLAADPSCILTEEDDCHSPPKSTIEEEEIEKLDPTCFKGAGDDNTLEEDLVQGQEQREQQCAASGGKTTTKRDKHWGDNPRVISMRDNLRERSKHSITDSRPPIFLIPGLASTRLVAWKVKKCSGALSSDIKMQDNVWLNINLVIRMGTTIDINCLKQCLELGLNQTDTDDWETGCKLRPDEGLDSIASLAPGGIGADFLVGGTNTVYSWLIQWLADNLGYDVTNMIAFPYDWRLTPSIMEKRDGFLSMMKKRIEGAVASSKQPGIMVAHSMGNLILRYFIEWLRVELREEAFQGYVKRARRKAQSLKKQQQQQQQQKHKQNSALKQEPKNSEDASSWTASLPGWVTSTLADVSAEVDEWYDWLTDEERDSRAAIKTNPNDSTFNLLTGTNNQNRDEDDDIDYRQTQLWDLAKLEGDEKWVEWLQTHIWTYVGLSAPMLGALNPLRAVISGENMGLPISDTLAREMELTFGSTHTLNPVSTKTGFCDDREANEWDEEPAAESKENESTLACLDDIANDIEYSAVNRDPWKDFPALRALMRDRIDWSTGKPMIDIEMSHCNSTNKNSCEITGDRIELNAKDVQDGSIFETFTDLWKEEGKPLIVKKEQLENSYMRPKVPNILNQTWDRPLIKHIVMAYGLDIPTEVGYTYSKKYNIEHSEDGDSKIVDRNETEIPNLKTVFWEGPRGVLTTEEVEAPRGSIGEYFMKKKPKRQPIEVTVPEARLQHCGDGSVPYLSLGWAQTWLLHAARARRFTEDKHMLNGDMKNALDHISISHRPQGESDWIDGPAPETMTILGADGQKADSDTGTSNPHGTRYKPLMKRYHNIGVSRTTGIEYTTSVIEAIGVEHKETTRNFDILAAVFTEVLDYMHDDLGLVSDESMKYSEPNNIVGNEE
mmetsp:Transcript_25978/g.60989  ORF Transcript_25978/g.60989 Transcript_25978/m.60989 type:complete len:1005 (+) Transcript_25978:242-3256(+)|eukprot:CAMPEP_0197177272 /NCGR_PEP_ID=MMETSP1423-20130617/2937_1 /TAXON_ID=476441 /ORGANISM="Pseudo-nitzschia heimii, Strain UNC1101" /LENGTH=1004 /DNA_ID=CAMNT_0042626795 /DNA_START=123 /DNA_END=3137 /DNA_ORIENTATION=+